VTGDGTKFSASAFQLHNVEPGNALVQLEPGIVGAKGVAIGGGKDNLAKGGKVF